MCKLEFKNGGLENEKAKRAKRRHGMMLCKKCWAFEEEYGGCDPFYYDRCKMVGIREYQRIERKIRYNNRMRRRMEKQ